MPPENDGSRYRAKILARVQSMKAGLSENPEVIKFRCLVNNEYEDVVAYNDICDHIEQDDSWDGVWKFRRILKHEKTPPGHKQRKGSGWNALIEWETGDVTWEPLHTKDKTGIL